MKKKFHSFVAIRGCEIKNKTLFLQFETTEGGNLPKKNT